MANNVTISPHAHYIVYSYSPDGESVWHYVGDDLGDAYDAYNFERKAIIDNYSEGQNITLAIKNNLNEEIIQSFNTEKDI